MRYIDNGAGDPEEEALYPWLREALEGEIVGLRWQAGYFDARVLGLFSPVLQGLKDQDLDTMVLIGSNERETQSSAVHLLVRCLGLPRENARLGVVSYSNGLFHPKTIHICYREGRQVAYVGSANMTERGISGCNVEAGVVLDTDAGDSIDILQRIRLAPEEWFGRQPRGLFQVECSEDVVELEGRGILAMRQPRRRHRDEEEDEGGRGALPRRGRGHVLPRLAEHFDMDISDSEKVVEVDIEEILAQDAMPEGDVLISTLAGPGRWGQAAFPLWFIENFFQVLPGTGEILRLFPVTQDEGLGAVEEHECGHKHGSRNWYYELGLAADIGAYPNPPAKPIGIFHRTGVQTCHYTILMPNDDSYGLVADFLRVNRNRLNRRGNELPRTIVPAAELSDAWPDNWFFGA